MSSARTVFASSKSMTGLTGTDLGVGAAVDAVDAGGSVATTFTSSSSGGVTGSKVAAAGCARGCVSVTSASGAASVTGASGASSVSGASGAVFAMSADLRLNLPVANLDQ